MRASKPQRTFVAALMLALSAALPAAAQQAASDASAQALARAQSLLRQLAQQKTAMEAELATLRAEHAKSMKSAAAIKAELAARTADLESAARETSGVKAKLSRREQQIERVTGQLREVVAKYKEKAATLRETEAARADLQTRLAATLQELTDAEKKNLALVRINRDILAEFEREGPWDGLLRKEPFSGLKRVEIENLVQDYEYEMGEHLRESSLEQLAAPAAP